MCYQPTYDSYVALGWSQAVSYVIVIVNYVLRLAMMILIKTIGIDTES